MFLFIKLVNAVKTFTALQNSIEQELTHGNELYITTIESNNNAGGSSENAGGSNFNAGGSNYYTGENTSESKYFTVTNGKRSGEDICDVALRKIKQEQNTVEKYMTKNNKFTKKDINKLINFIEKFEDTKGSLEEELKGKYVWCINPLKTIQETQRKLTEKGVSNEYSTVLLKLLRFGIISKHAHILRKRSEKIKNVCLVELLLSTVADALSEIAAIRNYAPAFIREDDSHSIMNININTFKITVRKIFLESELYTELVKLCSFCHMSKSPILKRTAAILKRTLYCIGPFYNSNSNFWNLVERLDQQ